MSELKSCPFCPDGGSVVRKEFQFEDLVFSAHIFCEKCGTRKESSSMSIENKVDDETKRLVREEVENAWNTRYELTCKKVPGKMIYGERRPKCSECGYGLGDSRWNYCPGCGCKVVDE